MDDINHSYITGRTASKVIIKKYDDIYKYSFIAAVNYKSQKKQKMYSDFIPVCYWRRYPCKKLGRLKIGDGVLIVGKVITRSYESKGEKQWVTEVQGKDFKKLHSKDMEKLIEVLISDSDLVDKVLSVEDDKLSDSFKKKLLSSIAIEDELEAELEFESKENTQLKIIKKNN
tara:strand:- start:7 stop:522 length:516 start_codon:yes stop_codon:yes gene_type:complete